VTHGGASFSQVKNMNSLTRAMLVVAAVMMAGSALADVDDRWLDNPESGWQANVPAFDSSWMVPVGGWEAELPETFPVEVDFPGLGDWDIGVEPPRRGEGEYRCMAIGCEDGGGYRDDIIVVDCSDGKPC
jgi:hypothetical protein